MVKQEAGAGMKESSRGLIKRRSALPYGAGTLTNDRKPSRSSHQGNYVSRVVKKVSQAIWRRFGSAQPPLLPGDIIRDFPFATQASEVLYFSTHNSLCEDIFGLSHGEDIYFHRGVWQHRRAVVVGARAGKLWVVLDDDDVARILPLPSSCGEGAPKGTIAERLRDYYGIERGKGEMHSDRFSRRVMDEVEEKARRIYSGEQINFLQRAPDLFASLVDEEDEWVNHTGSLVGEGPASEEGESASHLGVCAASSSDLDPSLSSCTSLYEAVANSLADEQRLVLLTPRVVSSSGILGWAGEGTVIADGGGVRHCKASLSASVVL